MPRYSNEKIVKVVGGAGPLGGLAVTAYLGAFIYFFQLDLTVGGFFLALLKAFVWPAYVVFEALQAFGVQ